MEVKIKKLELTNFKGVKYLEVKFNTDGTTAIYGENGTGKTTVMDAFLWLLFDKDSADRKQFGIKTLDADGKPMHRADHSVEGILSVNGKSLSLKKTFREKWQKKRGSADMEFTGHETTYEWEGVPLTMKEYNEKISEIMPEETFKLVTNPNYFTSLKWQTQREILFGMAADISIEGVAAGNKEFEQLIADMEGKTLEEYRKYIANQKRRIKESLAQIQPRIDEVKRSKPQKDNWKELELEIEGTDIAIKEIEESIADKSKAAEKQYAKRATLQEEIGKAKVRLSEIRAEVQSVVIQAEQERKAAISKLGAEVIGLNNQISAHGESIKHCNAGIERISREVEVLRKKWQLQAERELEFQESDFNCPTCKRPLDVDDIDREREQMTKAFNTTKAKTLEGISAEGKQAKADLASYQQKLADHIKSFETLTASKAEITARLEVLTQEQPEEADPVTDSRITETEKLIEQLQQQAEEPIESESTDDLKEQKQQLIAQRDSLRERLAAREAIKKADARISELEKEEETLAHELAHLEGIEFVIGALTRAYTDQVEQQVNSRFSLVRFKLFDVQVNGQEVETCEVTVEGVPYSDLNSASKINAGLDIINALSKHNGIFGPVFLDNSETVLQPLKTLGQLIKLIVATGYKELSVQ